MDEEYRWSDELRTGNIVVDTQHRMLFEVCNKLESDLETTDASAVIGELLHYTETHFANEERLMRNEQFPGIEAHANIHKKMFDEVRVLAKRCEAGQLSDMIRIRLYVQKWLRDHILGEDFIFINFLNEKNSK